MTATGYTSGDPNKVDVSNETSPVGFGMAASASYKISVGVGTDIPSVYSLNSTGGGNLNSPHFRADSAAASSLLVTSRVTGDSSSRFAATISGDLSWGGGSGSRDVNLKREAADILRTDDRFVIGSAYGAATYAALPKGITNRSETAGLIVGSSYSGGDDDGTGTDSTGRINLYAYQRANVGSFGETIRNFLMRSDAKAMTVWYGPEDGLKKSNYNATTRDPESGSTWKPWTWTGSHFEANNHASVHGHWEVEVPDSTGALQGRLEIPFIDQSKLGGLGGTIDDTTIGVDWTNIRTNLADFSVRAQNITSGDFTGQNTALRVGGNNAVNKDIVLAISSDMQTAGRRWIIRGNIDTEAGSNAGTNFQISRCADDGSIIGTPFFIQRSDGQITNGAASAKGSRFAAVWATSAIHGFSAQPSATIGSAAAFDAQMSATTERVFQSTVTGDANRRHVIYTDGKYEWGDGTATRDVNIYRSAAGVLKTDNSFIIGASLSVTTAINGGSSSSGNLTLNSTTHATKGKIFLGANSAYDEVNSRLGVGTTSPSMNIDSQRAVAGNSAYGARVIGDAGARFVINADGGMVWGSGAGSTDVSLFRSAADKLKTDDMFIAALGIGVGNSAAATTPGTVARKIQVFDAAGASLGFIPVYDAIS